MNARLRHSYVTIPSLPGPNSGGPGSFNHRVTSIFFFATKHRGPNFLTTWKPGPLGHNTTGKLKGGGREARVTSKTQVASSLYAQLLQWRRRIKDLTSKPMSHVLLFNCPHPSRYLFSWPKQLRSPCLDLGSQWWVAGGPASEEIVKGFVRKTIPQSNPSWGGLWT